MEITLLTRQDCAYCDAAKRLLDRLSTEYGFSVTALDLDSSDGQQLAEQGGVLFPPGIFIDGEPFAYGEALRAQAPQRARPADRHRQASLMPRSHGRKRTSRRYEPPPAPRRPSPPWRKRLGWAMAIVGGLLFLAGNIGARTGVDFLPFDPHHVIGQVAGAILGIAGLILVTSGR